MTDTLSSLPLVKYVDERISVNEKESFSFVRGPNQMSHQQIPAESVSSGAVRWSAVPPNINTVVDKHMRARIRVRAVFDAAPAFGTLVGLRQNPLSSVTETLSLTLNGTQVSQDLRDTINALSHYSDLTDRESDTFCPNMADQYQQYDDAIAFGNARNPLAEYGANSTQQTRDPRNYSVTLVTGTTYDIEWVEPIYISPLGWGDRQDLGLFGLRNLSVQFTLTNDLKRMFSIAKSSAANLTSVSFPDGEKPDLELTYMTLDVAQEIPRVVSWDLYEINRFVADSADFLTPRDINGTMAASKPMLSPTIQLASIPERMYVFLAPFVQKYRVGGVDVDRNINEKDSDTYAYISKANLTFDGQNGILSGASAHDLYQMSREAGSQQSWAQYSRFQGSVLALDFGKSIPLGPLAAAGVRSQNGSGWTLQLQVNYQNPGEYEDPTVDGNIVSSRYRMYVITVQKGLLQLIDGNMVKQQGVFTSDDVVSAKDTYGNTRELRFVYGGRSFFSKIGSVLKTASKVGNAVLPAAAALGIPGASQANFVNKAVRGRGGASGGKLVSRSRMIDALM